MNNIPDSRHRVSGASSEQDRAAGGRDARLVVLSRDVVARASVELKQFTDGGEYYAYLRWSSDGATKTRYIGRVGGSTRAERLRRAWAVARTKDLLKP